MKISYHVDVIGHLKHSLSYFSKIFIVLLKLKGNEKTEIGADRN